MRRMIFSVIKGVCQVCFESCPPSSFPKITKNCNHELNICKPCVNKHIAAQLDTQGDAEINCPFSGCRQKMQHEDVKRLASKELFERFDALMLRQTLRHMPEFRWCKNPRCNYGQINFDGDNAPIMTCKACGQKSCYVHDTPWHQGSTCSNYEHNRQGTDRATKNLLARETKPCPKCGVRIIKDGGCNHMACKVKTCKYEFCWLCSADYNKIRRYGNSAHKTTCEYYA